MAGRILRLIAALGFTAGLGIAAAWSIRVGLADYWFQQVTVPGTEEALRLTPDRSSYWYRLGLMTADEDPVKSLDSFRHAVAIDPLDANSWIQLGLASENRGDVSEAEKDFLRAAEADHGYLPRWSLANFYFRRNNPEKFWSWVRNASEMSHGDAFPLFRLCWQFTDDGQRIEKELGIGKPDLESGYLSFLLDQRHFEEAAATATHLERWNREEDTPILLAACDRFLQAKRAGDALEIWNSLAQAHRIAFEALDPTAGRSLTNGAFVVPPMSQGFDWHLPTVNGITAARQENQPGIRLRFSGDQPEDVESMFQYLPVNDTSHYKLRLKYRTAKIDPKAGPTWRVFETNKGTILAESGSLSSEEGAESVISFYPPSGCNLVRLALVYQRSPGTTRIQGTITLQEVELTKE